MYRHPVTMPIATAKDLKRFEELWQWSQSLVKLQAKLYITQAQWDQMEAELKGKKK